MKNFRDFNVGAKLYTGFGAVLVLLAIVTFMSYNNLKGTLGGFEGTISQDLGAQIANANIDRYMLQARRSEKDFLLRLDVKYVAMVDEAVAKLKAEAQNLEEIEQSHGDKEGAEKAATIGKNADIYLSGFHTVTTACQEKGLDENSGLQGQFREAAHALEAVATDSKDLQLKADLLTVRKNEKDYLLRLDQKYVKSVQEQLAVMQLNGRSSRLSASQKEALNSGASKYEASFLALVGKDQEITKQTDIMREAVHQLEPLIEDGYAKAAEAGATQTKSTIDAAESSAMLPILISMIALVLGAFIAFYVSRLISRPVSQMANVAQQIALGDVDHDIEVRSKDEIGVLAQAFRGLIEYMKGLANAAQRIADNDLTVKVEPKSDADVLGKSFKSMTINLSDMIRQLTDGAGQLVSAANEVASSSEQMSRGAKDQTDQMGQVSTAVEEMTATIVESSKNAGDATTGAHKAAETATSGGQIVNGTIQGMQRIAAVVRESAESIAKLAKSADQIGEIIGVIDDIADQTNLLALNAAIEAARAGEQGRGFAVVADEVRKLAERTGKATGEITGMIKGIQQETEEAVKSMETGIQEVDKGRELADQAGNSLTSIVSMAQQVQDMIQQIATASEEQSSAAEQISKNVENVTAIARESATGAQQSAAAAEELNRQAEAMRQMVSKFKVLQGNRA